MLPIPFSWRFAEYTVGLLATPEWTDDSASNGVVQLQDPLTVYTVVSPVASSSDSSVHEAVHGRGYEWEDKKKKKRMVSHARRIWKHRRKRKVDSVKYGLGQRWLVSLHCSEGQVYRPYLVIVPPRSLSSADIC